jgi:hypothetical protein
MKDRHFSCAHPHSPDSDLSSFIRIEFSGKGQRRGLLESDEPSALTAVTTIRTRRTRLDSRAHCHSVSELIHLTRTVSTFFLTLSAPPVPICNSLMADKALPRFYCNYCAQVDVMPCATIRASTKAPSPGAVCRLVSIVKRQNRTKRMFEIFEVCRWGADGTSIETFQWSIWCQRIICYSLSKSIARSTSANVR